MEMVFDIRKATNRDGDQIAILIDAVFSDYPGCIFDRAGEFPELDAIADDFTAGNGCIWVVEGMGVFWDALASNTIRHKSRRNCTRSIWIGPPAGRALHNAC